MGILVAASACGKGGASPPVREPVGPAATALVPCPSPDEVRTRLRALWNVPADHDLDATCTPGRFPAAGWAVSAVVDESEDEAWQRSVVLAAADGSAIALGAQEDIAPWYRAEGGGGVSYEARDFDGDGVDELVSRGGASHHGSSEEWLAIDRLAGGALASALSLSTHYDNGAAVEDEADAVDCDAAVTFVPEGRAITVRAVGSIETRRPGPPPEDCFVGPRVYRLVGGAFVADR